MRTWHKLPGWSAASLLSSWWLATVQRLDDWIGVTHALHSALRNVRLRSLCLRWSANDISMSLWQACLRCLISWGEIPMPNPRQLWIQLMSHRMCFSMAKLCPQRKIGCSKAMTNPLRIQQVILDVLFMQLEKIPLQSRCISGSLCFQGFQKLSLHLYIPLRIWTILHIISLYISVAELQRLSWQGGPAAMKSSCRGQNAKHVETWRELKSKQSRKSCFNLWKLEASNGICTESCLNSCVVSATVSMQVVLDRICCWDTESSAQGQRMIDHEHSNEIPTSVKQILSQKAINSALSTDAAYWALTYSYSWWPKTKLQNDWTPIPLIFFKFGPKSVHSTLSSQRTVSGFSCDRTLEELGCRGMSRQRLSSVVAWRCMRCIL